MNSKIVSIVFYVFFISLFSNKLNAKILNSCESLFTTFYNPHQLDFKIFDSTTSVGFIVPNETKIDTIHSNLTSLSSGSFLSVGTERGFMNAAIAKNKAKNLILIDRDDNVVLFNLINKALLSLAISRKDYLHLRLNASFDEIQNRVIDDHYLSDQDKATLLSSQYWVWWRNNVQLNKAWTSFHTKPEVGEDFYNSNYLFNDNLFHTISILAKYSNIFVLKSDLSDSKLQTTIEKINKSQNLKISLIDLSNAWQMGYLGHANTFKFIKQFSTQMNNDTNILLSYLKRSPVTGSTIFGYQFSEWNWFQNPKDALLLFQNLAQQEPSKFTGRPSFVMRRHGFED